MRKIPVAVLISGRGSNMEALLDAAAAPDYPARIALVLSNRPAAPGLEIARARGVEAVAVDARLFPDRPSHEAELARLLDGAGIEIVCLAGYMRLLTPGFVERYSGRMINIHPSLLPLFPGLDTHQRVLDSGMRIHGCTVHEVTAVMDEGPILAQAAIAVRSGDTADALAARLLVAEHRLYPLALRQMIEGPPAAVSGLLVES